MVGSISPLILVLGMVLGMVETPRQCCRHPSVYCSKNYYVIVTSKTDATLKVGNKRSATDRQVINDVLITLQQQFCARPVLSVTFANVLTTVKGIFQSVISSQY